MRRFHNWEQQILNYFNNMTHPCGEISGDITDLIQSISRRGYTLHTNFAILAENNAGIKKKLPIILSAICLKHYWISLFLRTFHSKMSCLIVTELLISLFTYVSLLLFHTKWKSIPVATILSPSVCIHMHNACTYIHITVGCVLKLIG